MEHSPNCTMYRFCSPTLIRLAALGTFPEGEGIRCGGDAGGAEPRPYTHPVTLLKDPRDCHASVRTGSQ